MLRNDAKKLEKDMRTKMKSSDKGPVGVVSSKPCAHHDDGEELTDCLALHVIPDRHSFISIYN